MIKVQSCYISGTDLVEDAEVDVHARDGLFGQAEQRLL